MIDTNHKTLKFDQLFELINFNLFSPTILINFTIQQAIIRPKNMEFNDAFFATKNYNLHNGLYFIQIRENIFYRFSNEV